MSAKEASLCGVFLQSCSAGGRGFLGISMGQRVLIDAHLNVAKTILCALFLSSWTDSNYPAHAQRRGKVIALGLVTPRCACAAKG